VDGHESKTHLSDADELLELELARFAGVKPVRDPGDGDDGDGGDGGDGGTGSGDDGDGDGGTGAGDGDGDGDGAGGTGKTFSESYVKQLRSEAATRRKREQELETELNELKRKDLSEKERAEQERDEAKTAAEQARTRARTALAKAEVLSAATQAGAVDPSTVYDLLAGKLEFNDDDEPQGVEDAVKALLESKPFLVGDGNGGGTRRGAGAGSGNGHSNRGGALTLERLKTMTATEIAALPKDEVDKVLAAGNGNA
jgi:hypothetical protein